MALSNEYNDRKIEERDYSLVKRISWGAIIAGFIMAVVINLALNLLGVGIGVGAIDPVEQNAPPSGLGTGAIIWYVVSTILSLIAGGWVAARLAGIPRRPASILHGLLTWCLFTIFSFYIITTVAGTVIGVTGKIAGQALSLVGQGVDAVVPSVDSLVQMESQQTNLSVQNIKQEAQQILRQSDQQALQPQNIKEEAQQAKQTLQNAVTNPAQLDEAISKVFNNADSIVSEVDKEALVNVLVERSNMSRNEAQQTVNRWVNQFQQVKQQFAQAKQKAKQEAEQIAADVSSAISTAAIVGFIGLVLGAISSAVGGVMGKPKEIENTYA